MIATFSDFRHVSAFINALNTVFELFIQGNQTL